MPVRNTTGNSRPLAVWSVIRVTNWSSSPGIWSASATRETFSRKRSTRLASGSSGAFRAASGAMSAPATSPGSGAPSAAEASAGAVPAGASAAADRLGEVLQPGLVLRVVAALQFGVVAGALQDRLEQVRGARAVGRHLLEIVEHRHEGAHGVQRPGGDARRLLGAAQRLAEPDPLPLGEHRDRGLGAVADPALGDVEDAAQVDLVGRVGDHLEVGD